MLIHPNRVMFYLDVLPRGGIQVDERGRLADHDGGGNRECSFRQARITGELTFSAFTSYWKCRLVKIIAIIRGFFIIYK